MNRTASTIVLLLALVASIHPLAGQESAQESESPLADVRLDGLSLRGIGPAMNGGRIADIAFHPDNQNVWYVAVGSGGVWKTENAGTTWDPIFDGQASYSIGSVVIDPSNPAIIWVGTGEDVGGRHVAFGDGVYKSTDSGRSWRNMGLEDSEHISTMIVHPEDSNTIWVSAQGPLWSPGGERGLYKSTDGGESWNRVLGDDEWVGVTDVVMDPRDPDVLFAATWQRHRTVAAYMGGGPGSGIHRSTDGGDTWTELTTGLPSSNMGKIGLAISPQDPDYVYAAIELDRRTGGVYTSTDGGGSWQRMSDAVSGGTGPHYYQELYASPHQFGRLYLVSNYMLISDDHGANFVQMNVQDKHVDDHAVAFRKDDPNYLLVGTDGGLYETYDLTATWRFVSNLPVMQYYKISVDDAEPFYHVFGGTQDNGSNGGPSRTDTQHGIRNADWFKTLGADGHDSATEPGNPNIIYAESQQGNLRRVDRITGEQVMIQPQAGEGEDYERYNWDAPVEVSHHQPTRLYFASQRVWRTDDRGDSWTAISGDLTRNQERVALPIMGRVQSIDNPWDISAMSNYNTITSIGESPMDEDVVWAGTDDGLLHVTEDGGGSWREIEVGSIEGLPETAFVNDIKADRFDRNTVYVALDNHKYGDFTPYLVKSTDLGETWTSLGDGLPDRHLVWRTVQDHVDPELLFAATEFALFFSIDGGDAWTRLPGAPPIAFRDVVIQRTHEDLVGGTFGRGIFILDDYTPLRELDSGMLEQEAALLEPRTALWYQPKNVVDSQGANDYAADNPPFGAVFTYYLRDEYRSIEAERRAGERAIAADEDIPFPGWEALEAELREQGPYVQIVITDEGGNVVNRVDVPGTSGVHRASWNLRRAPQGVVDPGSSGFGGFGGGGFLALPGSYEATLLKIEAGVESELAEPVSFDVEPLREGALERAPAQVVEAFREEVEAFDRELTRVDDALDAQIDRVEAMQLSLGRAGSSEPALRRELHDTRQELLELRTRLAGSEARRMMQESSAPTPGNRLSVARQGLATSYGPTELHRSTLAVGRRELEPIRAEVERMTDEVVPALEQRLEAAGAPPIGNPG